MKLNLRIKNITARRCNCNNIGFLTRETENKSIQASYPNKDLVVLNFNTSDTSNIILSDFFSKIENIQFYNKEILPTKNVCVELEEYSLSQENVTVSVELLETLLTLIGLTTDLVRNGDCTLLLVNSSDFIFEDQNQKTRFEDLFEKLITGLYQIF